MIARLRGTVLEVEGERLVLDVGGVGFEVGVPTRTTSQASLEAGAEASLFTYLHVRDDTLQLYGFPSQRERAFFRLLIGVNGVGPRVALAILSAYPVEDLELAVLQADAKRFESISGIGKKLAQRLIVELKDRSMPLPPGESVAGAQGSRAGSSLFAARSALINLGMTLADADAALKGAPADASLEDLLKYALRKKESS